MSSALDIFPYIRISSPHSADSLPTLLTGTYPHKHGLWGVKIKDHKPPKLTDTIMDKLPDILTTTVQCLYYVLIKSYTPPLILVTHNNLKKQ